MSSNLTYIFRLCVGFTVVVLFLYIAVHRRKQYTDNYKPSVKLDYSKLLSQMQGDNTKSTTQVPHNYLKPIEKSGLYEGNEIQTPALYLQMKGRIGNQLYQFSCMYAQAKRNGWPLYISADNFLLQKFNVPKFMVKKWKFPSSGNYQVVKITDDDIHKDSYIKSKNTIVTLSTDAYCQSERYFFDVKEDLFFFFQHYLTADEERSVQTDMDKICNASGVAVGVHFRRGDYLKIKVNISESFQTSSMREIRTMIPNVPIHFFLFSDDHKYLQTEFPRITQATKLIEKDNVTFTIVSKPEYNEHEDFELMRRCDHFVIPNSSFSWWVAYLSRTEKNRQSKVVIGAEYTEMKNEALAYYFHSMSCPVIYISKFLINGTIKENNYS